MAEANRFQLSCVRESTAGTTPSSALTEVLIVDGGQPLSPNTVRSATLRDDAQLADSKKVGEAPRASYNFELAAASYYDEWMRGAVRSDADWTTQAAVAGSSNISAEASGNRYTSGVVDLTNGGKIVKGMWIYVAGFSTAANNGWKKVTAAASGALTVSGGVLANESNKSATMKGSYLLNGTTKHSYSLQQWYADLTNHGHKLLGARLNQFGLQQQPNGIIRGSVAFDGMTAAQIAAKIGNGSVTDAAAKDVRTEVDGFDGLWYDYTAVTADIMGLGFQVATPNRPGKPLGQSNFTRIEQGALNASGSLSFYMEDGTWAKDTDFRAFTKFSLAFALDMGGGDRYLFEFPQVAFTEEPQQIRGVDTDIMFEFSWQGEPGGSFTGSSLEKTICVCRVQA